VTKVSKVKNGKMQECNDENTKKEVSKVNPSTTLPSRTSGSSTGPSAKVSKVKNEKKQERNRENTKKEVPKVSKIGNHKTPKMTNHKNTKKAGSLWFLLLADDCSLLTAYCIPPTGY
jgi:hypothetical protein